MIKKYIKLKKYNDILPNKAHDSNKFHKENEEKVFEIIDEYEEYYIINEYGGSGLYKWRFEEFKLVNLPDELFKM